MDSVKKTKKLKPEVNACPNGIKLLPYQASLAELVARLDLVGYVKKKSC